MDGIAVADKVVKLRDDCSPHEVRVVLGEQPATSPPEPVEYVEATGEGSA